MATREENLKKINAELEQLSDEQLEEIAGGAKWIEKIAGGAQITRYIPPGVVGSKIENPTKDSWLES